jgi:hypothetical protein
MYVCMMPDGISFKPKIPIWVNFRGPWNGTCYIILPFGIYYGHFGTFYGHLVI